MNKRFFLLVLGVYLLITANIEQIKAQEAENESEEPSLVPTETPQVAVQADENQQQLDLTTQAVESNGGGDDGVEQQQQQPVEQENNAQPEAEKPVDEQPAEADKVLEDASAVDTNTENQAENLEEVKNQNDQHQGGKEVKSASIDNDLVKTNDDQTQNQEQQPDDTKIDQQTTQIPVEEQPAPEQQQNVEQNNEIQKEAVEQKSEAEPELTKNNNNEILKDVPESVSIDDDLVSVNSEKQKNEVVIKEEEEEEDLSKNAENINAQDRIVKESQQKSNDNDLSVKEKIDASEAILNENENAKGETLELRKSRLNILYHIIVPAVSGFALLVFIVASIILFRMSYKKSSATNKRTPIYQQVKSSEA
jgi:hypothetical protein